MKVDPCPVVARPDWIWPGRQDACQTPSEWDLLGGLAGRSVLRAWLGVGLNPGLTLSFGISPLVVGLTVVAFGTSAPEMAVSVQSAWSGQVDIALGNVVGNNIFNILSVLGLSADVTPGDLSVAPAMLSFDVPAMGGFVPPLLAVTLVVLAVRHWRLVHPDNRI